MGAASFAHTSFDAITDDCSADRTRNGEAEARFIEISAADGALYGEVKGRGKVRLLAQTETMFNFGCTK